ncbi:MAG TPA: FAD-dependent oxidoreductase [Candidatus Angelobacter sp.]|nr:FAD-dependent oxidoreductase [Candidatus Angelobacter sp.]
MVDFAIIGAGVFGSWTAHCLRRRGASVKLLDAYGAANSRASSGGETRVIRMGYGPDELYTRWSARSLLVWKEFAERTGQQFFHQTGVLWLSNDADAYTMQLLDVLNRNKMVCEKLSATEIRRRWPQLSFGDVTWGVLEPESGLLMARQAVQALVKDAVRNGVEFTHGSVLPPVSSSNKLNAVRTSTGDSIAAGVFIFACGPWLPKLFPSLLAGRISPTRQEVFFLGPPSGSDGFRPPKMPVWLHHTYPDLPYALPDIENRGFKIAFDRHGSDFDPDSGPRIVGEKSITELRAYLKDHIPALHDAPIVETRVCQYENTSNGDFLIDRHPDFENVWMVGGGSGHGFKHGPAVGEYVSARILDNAPAEPRFFLATKLTMRRRAIF